MNKRLLLYLFIGWSSILGAQAQYDPLYNQYVFNQALINPAYNGAFDNASVTFLGRAQWLGIEGAPITNSLNANTSIFDNKGGVGLSVIDDRLGVSNTTEALIAFSYKVDFGDYRLAAGLQGGVVQYRYNYADLNMEYINDPSFIPADENFVKPNFGMGIMFYSEYYYAGISIPRILNVEVNDGVKESTRYRKHYYISGGIVLPLSEILKIKPSTLIKVADSKISVDINATLLIKEIVWAGVLIRNFNSYGVLGQLQISDRLRIGYSFEIPSTKLVTNQWGTHEIMIGFDFAPLRSQILKRKYF